MVARNRRLRGAAMRDFHNRETVWARQQNVVSLAANGNYTTQDLLSVFKADGGNQQGVTVTRVHLIIATTNATASGDAFSWGTMVGQNVDVGASIAGAPTPDVDPYEDWNFWRLELACANTGGSASYWPAGNQWTFDVKAQRRLHQIQQSFNLVVHRQTVAAAALQMTITSSVLLKLP